jgi:hypothetical protein
MAAPICIPDQQQLSPWSGDGFQFKLIPTVPISNTAFNCTIWTVSPALNLTPGTNRRAATATTLVPTVVAADATGITLSLTATQIATARGALGNALSQYTFTSQDGSGNTGIFGAGNLQVNDSGQ